MQLKERMNNDDQKKTFFFSKGVLYFNRGTERFVFFILTIIMAGLGLLVKIGLF